MKHIRHSGDFNFSSEPFPAFRCEHVFGRNKRDFAFLPCQVIPEKVYRITYLSSILKISTPKEFFTPDEFQNFLTKNNLTCESGCIRVNGCGCGSANQVLILPENRFQIMKSSNGTIGIVSGEDMTPRILLEAGWVGGFRGNCGIHDDSDARILVKCHAVNNCESAISVMTILEPGQKLIIWSNGRRCDDVKIWAWDGSTLNISDMRNSEYEAKKDFMLIDKGEII